MGGPGDDPPKAAKVLMGGGFDADPLANAVLRQRIDCLPHTEYEVTVFAKHDVTAVTDYYGGFAVVGNVDGRV